MYNILGHCYKGQGKIIEKYAEENSNKDSWNTRNVDGCPIDKLH